jgi:hypothetical protein
VGQQLLDLGVIVPVRGAAEYVVSDQNLYQFRGKTTPAPPPPPHGAGSVSGQSGGGRPLSSSSFRSGSLSMRSGSIARFN